MDKTRKILLIIMCSVALLCLVFIGLNIYWDKKGRFEKEILSYREKIEELESIQGDISQLEQIKDSLMESPDLSGDTETIHYQTVYDFSQDVIKFCQNNSILINNYRFIEEKETGINLLEINFNASPYFLSRYLNKISRERSSWYITRLMVNREKKSTSGTIRLGYE